MTKIEELYRELIEQLPEMEISYERPCEEAPWHEIIILEPGKEQGIRLLITKGFGKSLGEN